MLSLRSHEGNDVLYIVVEQLSLFVVLAWFGNDGTETGRYCLVSLRKGCF